MTATDLQPLVPYHKSLVTKGFVYYSRNRSGLREQWAESLGVNTHSAQFSLSG
jgi:hypothetical protein